MDHTELQALAAITTRDAIPLKLLKGPKKMNLAFMCDGDWSGIPYGVRRDTKSHSAHPGLHKLAVALKGVTLTSTAVEGGYLHLRWKGGHYKLLLTPVDVSNSILVMQ